MASFFASLAAGPVPAELEPPFDALPLLEPVLLEELFEEPLEELLEETPEELLDEPLEELDAAAPEELPEEPLLAPRLRPSLALLETALADVADEPLLQPSIVMLATPNVINATFEKQKRPMRRAFRPAG